MRWRAIGLLVVVLALAAAGAAAGAPRSALPESFVRFCGETGGDAGAALQRADADGWAPAPPNSLTAVPFGTGKWVDLRGRWRRQDGALSVLEVGTIRDADGKRASVCTVAETPPSGSAPDTAAIRRALQRWIGGPPLKTSDSFAIFAYRVAAGRRVPLPASQDPFAGDAVRADPEMMLVSLVDVFGVTPAITLMRWR